MDRDAFEADVEDNPHIEDWHTHDELFHVETELSWEDLAPSLDRDWELRDQSEDMLLLAPIP
jgi:hypothetical protein